MPRRHIIRWVGWSLVITVAIAAHAALDDRRRYAAAEAAIPSAQAFLRTDPRYQSVQAEASHYQGAGLWFTGSLPTQAECDELERLVEKRYGSEEFLLMYPVLSSNGQ